MSSSLLFYPGEPDPPRTLPAHAAPDESPDSRGCLTRLVENWVVMPEEWDELPPELRSEILHPSSGDVIDKLVENHLLTQFQADKVR